MSRLPGIGYAMITLGFLTLLLTACGLVDASGPTRLLGGYESNGERIYFTGTNDKGERIRYSGGPPSGGMMGSSLTCASCHGEEGRGGLHTMHMRIMDAPDIRWSSLRSGEHGDHGEEGEDEHEEAAYDRETFFRAVREGIEPGGHILSDDMPRWDMTDEDLDDLIEFLRSLSED